MASQIKGAKFLESRSNSHMFIEDSGIWDHVFEFLTGEARQVEIDRVLTTVLFTDIVGSTQRAASEGDRAWRRLLERHDECTDREVNRFRGRLVKTTGDGAFACFDGPVRAIRCARAIAEGVHDFGIEIRAGLHTGECEARGDDLAGITVHIGARVCGMAEANEVLISRTVRDLVYGSSLTFEDRGDHHLKGVPGTWNVFSVLAV